MFTRHLLTGLIGFAISCLIINNIHAANSQFTKTEPSALAVIQNYKTQQKLGKNGNSILLYLLTDENPEHRLAVRSFWSVPAGECDKAFDDDHNKIRSRIVINETDKAGILLFKINIIDDTQTNERFTLESRIAANPQPVTIANWSNKENNSTVKKIVMLEYGN